MELKQFASSMMIMGEMLPGKPNLENPVVLQFWFDEFGALPDEDLKNGFRLALSTLDRFPVIAKFRELVDGPTQSRDQTAIEIAGKVWDSLGKFGQYKPDLAEAWLGSVGWQVVQLLGGWYNITETTTDDDRGTFTAQSRGFANAILAREGINDRGHKMIGSGNSELVKKLAQGTLTIV